MYPMSSQAYAYSDAVQAQMNAANQASLGQLNTLRYGFDEYVKKAKEKKKMEDSESTVKGYFKRHHDALLSIAVVLILDHFVFGGKFRTKIEEMVEGFLSRAKAKLPHGLTAENV